MATTDHSISTGLGLYSLPNEVLLALDSYRRAFKKTDHRQVLVQILTPFSTRALLPLTCVSHRFHAIILRILHYRLLLAASLEEYKLMLECFHPSSRLTDPHVFCTYLGTDGLSNKHEGEGSLYENCGATERLGRLTSLYSRFRPDPEVEDQRPWRPRNRRPPTGLAMGPEGGITLEEDADSSSNEQTHPVGQFVKKRVNLDGFEDFSQLCAVVNLVKGIPNSSLVLSAVTVEDGIVRIGRKWLKEQAAKTIFDAPASSSSDEGNILWVGGMKNVGMKLRVREKRWSRDIPILVHRDEELAVSYEVEIEGKFALATTTMLMLKFLSEIRIRTTRLLLTVEQSLNEQRNYTKAVIIGAVRIH